MAQVIASGLHDRVNVRVHTSSGLHWFELELSAHRSLDGRSEVLVVGRNISGQQETKERLLHMATHDALTGLPNRALLSDRLRMAFPMRAAPAAASPCWRSTSTVSRKSTMRSAWRRQRAAARGRQPLQNALRDNDTLARVGGDEFWWCCRAQPTPMKSSRSRAA